MKKKAKYKRHCGNEIKALRMTDWTCVRTWDR